MNRHLGTVLGFLVLGLTWLCSCTRTPEKLALQVAAADHLVALDRYYGCELVITGYQAAEVIRAVSAAKGLPRDQTAATAPDCEIQFLRGTNLLAKIPIQDKWFATGDGEYIEKGEVLKTLQRRLESDQAGQRAWTISFIRNVLQSPEFGNLQSWSVETLQRYATGKLKIESEGRNEKLHYSEIPRWMEAGVQATGVFMPSIYVRQDATNRAKCLVFDWYNYGILVGSTNYTTTFQAWYITNAVPGIYAFHSQQGNRF